MPKNSPATEVSANDYQLAKQRWDDYWAIENEGRPYQAFHRFLGMHAVHAPPNAFITIMLHSSAARKIELICGPYYNAVLAKIRIEKLP